MNELHKLGGGRYQTTDGRYVVASHVTTDSFTGEKADCWLVIDAHEGHSVEACGDLPAAGRIIALARSFDDPSAPVPAAPQRDDEVRLSDEHVARIDAADAPRVRRRKWRAQRAGDRFYAVSSVQNKGHVALGRFLLDAGRDQVVTYKNGDTLDNRRANISLTTRAEILRRVSRAGAAAAQAPTCAVALTHDKVALIDASDRELVERHAWSAMPGRGRRWYAVRYPGTPSQQSLGQYLLDPAGGLAVTHRNGDTLDCRRSNLVRGDR